MKNRRSFLKKAGLGSLALGLSNTSFSEYNTEKENSAFLDGIPISSVKPKLLKKGDKIAIVAPGGAIFNQAYTSAFPKKLQAMGFQTVVGKSCYAQHGQFAGTDELRAQDLMKQFEDPEIKAIIAMRGGSGTARILETLDYESIKRKPKIVMGFSDITSLINALYAKTGLIGFHGPVGYSSWGSFTRHSFTKAISSTTPQVYTLPSSHTCFTLREGKAKGHLVGGNLSVLVSLLGTPFFPNTKNAILFLEEIDEEPYAIDRLLTQLRLAGKLEELTGIVLGNFKRCEPEEKEKSMSLSETFETNLKGLNIPIFGNAPFGHTTHKWTLPVGVQAEMNASTFELKLLENGVE